MMQSDVIEISTKIQSLSFIQLLSFVTSFSRKQFQKRIILIVRAIEFTIFAFLWFNRKKSLVLFAA